MAAPATALPSIRRPPEYGEVVDVCQPTILILAGQFIHAETADSPPLYHLNRGVTSLTHATRSVEFQRVQYSIRTGSGGEPSVKPRERHIYNLRHMYCKVPSGIERWPSDSPNYFIEPVSRTTRDNGTLGMKKAWSKLWSGPKHLRWKVLPVDMSGRTSKNRLPTFIKDARPVFLLNLEQSGFGWTDADGKAVAVEDVGDGMNRLIVTVELPRKTLDVLVALWCCRMFQYSADNTKGIDRGVKSLWRKNPAK